MKRAARTTRAREDYEKTWDEFWKPLVCKRGRIDMDAVKRELHDYHTFMQEGSVVYDHITGGRISKVSTVASIVIAEHDEVCHGPAYPERHT